MGTCVFTQQDVEILKFLKTHTLVITSLNDEGVGQIKVHVDVLRDLLKESFTDLEDRAEGILEDIKWARMIHLEWTSVESMKGGEQDGNKSIQNQSHHT